MKSKTKVGELNGIPVLLKDSINTKDMLNSIAGSYALLGVENPYVDSGDPYGSSSGSAISVASNMVAVSLGTETNGSIICPADHNSVIGFKPTVGLTSRAGVIPISPRQDSVGRLPKLVRGDLPSPLSFRSAGDGTTVSDAVYVLDAIVGFDPRDSQAIEEASKFIPNGGYKQFFNKDGLTGKRLGVVRNPFSYFYNESTAILAFEAHLNTLRQRGAILVDNLEKENIDIIMDPNECGESTALLAELKLNINGYLRELTSSPVSFVSLQEKTDEYGQEVFMASEMTNGIGEEERTTMEMLAILSRDGFEKLMKENELDATVTLGPGMAPVLTIGGYPGITVRAGYDEDGMPFGICFGGLRGMEPKLIEVAYGFEQPTMIRRPPA
ncbi:hypothetical protein VitviT2T_003087 [Vitis vinifera]|uniref:Amidase domain-containing protein n=1 Tax=Vitis vinifera TaxID=29760 RepID=A0ABY9BKH8_VITVI|nr:hypothetical protein VitviT2T_003087 [Vitis vinifera]